MAESAIEAPAEAVGSRGFRHRRRRARTSGDTVTVEPDEVLDAPVGDEDDPVGRFGLAAIGLASIDPAEREPEGADDESAGFGFEPAGDSSYETGGDEVRDTEEADEVMDVDDPADGAGRDEVGHGAGHGGGRDFDAGYDDELGHLAAYGSAVDHHDDEFGSGAYDDAEKDEDDVRVQAERCEEDFGTAAPEAGPAGEEPLHRRMARAVLARSLDVHPELAGVDAASVFATTGTTDGGGNHVEGWVRPHYDDEDEPTGDYWTPVPHHTLAELDRAPYGWPTPVERLPLIPPEDGLADEPEPTGVLPQWPPAQPSGTIEVPRRWSSARRRPLTGEEAPWLEADRDGRDGWERAGGPPLDAPDWTGDWSDAPEPQRAYGPEDSDSWPVSRPVEPKRRRGRRKAEDTTHLIPAVSEKEPRRRPRPRPGPDGEAHSTVYRSRHAADQ